MSVKVAVRVRPFTAREAKGGRCCVRMVITTSFDKLIGINTCVGRTPNHSS